MASFFFEMPWAIAITGILITTVLGGAWLQTGFRGLLIGAIVSILLTGVLLITERSVVTESERIHALVLQIAKEVENGDLPALLGHFHEEAGEIRRQAEAELPRYKIKEVHVKSGMKVEILPQHAPPKAVAEFNVVVVGGDATGLITDQRVPRYVIVTFYKEGDEWKIWNYQHLEPTHGMTLSPDNER